MAFEKIEKTSGGRHGYARPTYIGMSCRNGGSKADPYLVGTIAITAEILERIGWPLKCRVVIERGNDQDAGMLRLTKGGLSGFTVTRAGKDSRTGVLIVRALAADTKVPAAPVDYRIEDGAIYITLPEWARG